MGTCRISWKVVLVCQQPAGGGVAAAGAAEAAGGAPQVAQHEATGLTGEAGQRAAPAARLWQDPGAAPSWISFVGLCTLSIDTLLQTWQQRYYQTLYCIMAAVICMRMSSSHLMWNLPYISCIACVK